MHTYTPTASHDPVVEFDNGDLGNQTNLNNMVRALGNRSQLAKQTNDTQDADIDTLLTQMTIAYNPATLTADLVISLSSPEPYTSGEEIFALASAAVTGNDVASGLAAVTYTGSGGGTKLIRLGPNSRYLVHCRVLVSAWASGPSSGTPSPTGNETAEVQFYTATDTALSVSVSTVETVRAQPWVLTNAPSSYTKMYWDIHRTLQVKNTTASPLYLAAKWLSPNLSAGNSVTDFGSESVVVVQRVGTA